MILPQQTVTTRILAGQALSGPVSINNAALTAIRMPAAWDAAGLTFQCAIDPIAGSWLDLFDAQGAEVVATVEASRHVALSHLALRGLLWLRCRSGFGAAPITQAADRDLILIFGGVA
jgi:hypothetical protein